MNLPVPNITPIPLVLAELRNGRKGFTPAFGQALAEAASVCLEEQGHSSPTQMQISGRFEALGQLEWINPSDQARRCWNDDGYPRSPSPKSSTPSGLHHRFAMIRFNPFRVDFNLRFATQRSPISLVNAGLNDIIPSGYFPRRFAPLHLGVFALNRFACVQIPRPPP
ncbi:MAG: hypothetical protein ABSD57_12165 [Verrucomicrobiota bacterium]|jgi:hypothetical protein